MVSAGSPGLDGPEQNPIPVAPQVAPPGYLQQTTDVNGIKCLTKEQMAFHVHARLTVFVNGTARQIPAAIGIAPPLGIDQKPNGMFFINNGSCFAWLHTHTPDGIIHIESPIQRQFTLGDFFDVWGQPLGPDLLGLFHGTVTAFLQRQALPRRPPAHPARPPRRGSVGRGQPDRGPGAHPVRRWVVTPGQKDGFSVKAARAC